MPEVAVELFELVLILLACVIVSSILEQVFTRLSLPLVQIAVGLVVALLFPSLGEIHVESELFLVLFIAPLLFNEAFEADAQELWRNKGSILSLAIALVIATVLVMGFTLHAIVPSIPLAAAFACAAALGPTDAAAVTALGSTVNLNTRQKTLLSGEALINDASGVVSFQFAIAAAVTGAFSLADASASFAVLFFGGILAGLVMGAMARVSMDIVRSRGFENTTVRVIYEVLTPFVVFLAAESIHVSGILAVVAAGLVMAQRRPRLASTADAHHRMVASSLWEVIVFLINGVIFVMLGMQLPICIGPILDDGISPSLLFGLIVLMTIIIVVMRFAWLAVMELRHRDAETGHKGKTDPINALRDALVTTIAGPKGSVTLSIILTMPLYTEAGAAFPARDLIIFLTAGTILATLLLANYVLPVISRKPEGVEDENAELSHAAVKVYSGVIDELLSKVESGSRPEYEPATQLAIARYRTRLARTRLSMEACGEVLTAMVQEVLDVQQKRADEIQQFIAAQGYSASEAAPYYSILRTIRSSVGYFNNAEKVGSRFYTIRGNLAMLRHNICPKKIDSEKE
ncbi:MAG: Na+/H+ antiporter, partial [Eggerthellaceae bacterium]|nr:Na+/H+ antiporter [Eggerthellaceae bacterium]